MWHVFPRRSDERRGEEHRLVLPTSGDGQSRGRARKGGPPRREGRSPWSGEGGKKPEMRHNYKATTLAHARTCRPAEKSTKARRAPWRDDRSFA